VTLRAGTLGAPGAAAGPLLVYIILVLLDFEHGSVIGLLTEASYALDLQLRY
jgi:hypothetical protein